MQEINEKVNQYFEHLKWKYYFSAKLANRTIMRLERRCEKIENSVLQLTLENELARIENEEIREKIRACHNRMVRQ
jgi:hypothetical protein